MQGDQEIDNPLQPYHPRFRKSDYPPFFFTAIDERGIPLRSYIRLVWNRRWIILAAALATVVVVAIRSLREKPVYKAVGTLEIEMPKQSVTNIQDFFPSANVPDSYLQTQSKILVSGQLISQVVDALKPPGHPKSASAESRSAEQLSFNKHLDVQVLKGSQLIQASFESENPVAAAQAVNKLMSLYIKQLQAERSEIAEDASGWLMEQLKEEKAKLEDSMDVLHRYEREHQLLSLDPDRERLMNIDAGRLQQLQEELAHTESSRMEKEGIYRRVRAGDTQMLQSGLLDEDLKKMADLEGELTQLLKKLGPRFPQVQRKEVELAQLRTALAAERDRLSKEIVAEYESAVEQEARIRGEIVEQRQKVTGSSDQLLQYNVLKHDVDLNEQSYDGLLQKLQEATTTASMKTVSARIVDPAEPPAISNHPGLARNLALSLLFGTCLGIGLAIGEEVLRETIKSAGEIEADLNLPLLGIVPAMNKAISRTGPYARRNGDRVRHHVPPSKQGLGPADWFRLDKDGSDYDELSEAIRNLRTSLLFALQDKGPRSVLFGSSLPSEGKTTISSNISISLTQLGKRVLVIDGDLRRPCLHKVFSTPNRKGLSEYLQGECDWEEVTHPSNVATGLDIITCGQRPLNPAELLSSGRMRRVIEQAKLQYDIVVIDSPALLNMADSRILASYVDDVVLVIKSRATPKILAKQACANIRGTGATIIGAVLNQLDTGDSEYSYSYLEYGYPKPGSLLEHEEEGVSQT